MEERIGKEYSLVRRRGLAILPVLGEFSRILELNLQSVVSVRYIKFNGINQSSLRCCASSLLLVDAADQV